MNRLGLAILAAALCGCSSADSRATDAYARYQAAAARNDLVGARRALLEALAAKDDNADAWQELGRLQIGMNNYNGAYDAYSRAYELDRSNPDILRALLQLSISTGDLNEAGQHVKELAVVAPDDPWVKLANGFVSIGNHQYAQALAFGNELLKDQPNLGPAVALKARALVGLNKPDEAIKLLEAQIAAQPSDVSSLSLLMRLYLRNEDWPNVERIATLITRNDSGNNDALVNLIEGALRVGDVQPAFAASEKLFGRQDMQLTQSVLDLWRDYWSSPSKAQEASKFATIASGSVQKLAVAEFLIDNGLATDAGGLIQGATLPINASNAQANAVLGYALAKLGKVADAKQRLDAVLKFDNGNPTALRARAKLLLAIGQPLAAVQDAQSLATALPKSADARILLAQAYLAAGDRPSAKRALYDGFNNIPADDQLLGALVAMSRGDPERVQSLKKEFAAQRETQFMTGAL